MPFLQVRLSEEYDADIISWLDAQESKTHATKDAIRLVMGLGHQPRGLDFDSVIDNLAGVVRAAIESALDERLSGIAPDCDHPAEDREVAAKLDSLF